MIHLPESKDGTKDVENITFISDTVYKCLGCSSLRATVYKKKKIIEIHELQMSR
jgi:hypothetical protein